MRPIASILLISTGLLLGTPALQAENLYDIYQLAVDNDPVMKASAAQLRSEQETANLAKGQLLPHIYLTASYGKEDSDSTQKSSGNSIVSQSDTTDSGISVILTQPLFTMDAWYAFRSGKRLSEKAEIEFASNQQSLILRTIDAYLYVLRIRNNLASSIAEEQAIKQQLDQTRQRFDVGLVAITDVHESQSAHDLARTARLANEGNLSIALENLTLLTGKSHTGIDNLSEMLPVSSPDPVGMDQWVSLASSGNYDLKKTEVATEAARYNARSAESRHYPALSLNANYTDGKSSGLREGENLGTTYKFDDFEADSNSSTVALVLTVPLYSGGIVSASRRQAYANLDVARESLDGLKRTVTQQTRAQYIAVETNIQKVAAFKQATVSAKSALDAVQAGYNVGTRNIVDVLAAQKNLFAAQRDYANSRYDYILSLMNLKKLAGKLTPADIQSINQWVTPNESP